MYFKDIINETDKTVELFGKLRERYSLSNNDFLKYLTLLHSIPNAWKLKIKNENLNIPIAPTLISQIIKTNQTNQYIYRHILKKQTPVKKAEEKWNDEFENQNLNWKKIYTISLAATKDVKLRNFHYKYIMRIIPTNKFLLKCGIGESALCDFCNMEIETIDHLFWQCKHVQTFWTEFSHFLSDLNIDIEFNLINIAFGFTITIGKPEIMLKNFLIILGKYFIFRGRCLKIIPTLNQFKSFLRNRIKIEKEIYFMKDKLAQFEIMWGKFDTFTL